MAVLEVMTLFSDCASRSVSYAAAMLSRAFSAAVNGIEAFPVGVEVDVLKSGEAVKEFLKAWYPTERSEPAILAARSSGKC